MKLQLTHEFELEVKDKIYTGEFRDLTKKEIKSIDKLTPKKELKELKKLERKPTLTPKEDERMNALLEVVIEGYDVEDVYKARLEVSVLGDDRDAILHVGEVYGYQRVLDAIIEDISERRAGN